MESYDRNTKRVVRGKLSLVDLAGSERADKTGGNAERLKEGQSINKSLSALGDVMAALSEGGKTFVPYRNNKLTQLMQDSLGGNAKTLMFVNFSPADYNADETVTSLNFATRVKKVVNTASKVSTVQCVTCQPILHLSRRDIMILSSFPLSHYSFYVFQPLSFSHFHLRILASGERGSRKTKVDYKEAAGQSSCS